MLRNQVIYLTEAFGTTLRTKGYAIQREHSYADQMMHAWSEALFCPYCQRVWATLQFEGDTAVWPRAQSCVVCNVASDWIPVPGSLLIEQGWGVIDESLLAGLPDELVEREFQLHLKAAETWQSNEGITTAGASATVEYLTGLWTGNSNSESEPPISKNPPTR